MSDLEWIRNGLKQGGKSQAGLARALGIDPAGVSKMLSGTRLIKANELPKIRNYLANGDGAADNPQGIAPEGPSAAAPRAAVEPLTFPGATRDLEQYMRPVSPMRAGARDVPIYGYAKGGKDAYFVDQGAKLGMAYRPNALDSVPDAFAIEIWDHSMHPALKHGHQALIHPNKRPAPGEEVLVTLIDGQAMVKELVRDTERVLVLRQHNPPEEIKIERKRVAKVQLIVDSPRVRI